MFHMLARHKLSLPVMMAAHQGLRGYSNAGWAYLSSGSYLVNTTLQVRRVPLQATPVTDFPRRVFALLISLLWSVAVWTCRSWVWMQTFYCRPLGTTLRSKRRMSS